MMYNLTGWADFSSVVSSRVYPVKTVADFICGGFFVYQKRAEVGQLFSG